MNFMEADWLYEDVRHAEIIRSYIPEEELETNKDLKRLYEIRSLVKAYWNKYDEDNSYISDDDYDELARELVTIEKKYLSI
jgi:hypothetical protein